MSLATSSIMPDVSRRTFGFSQIVTEGYPCSFAYSNAARTIRWQAPRVNSRTERAMSCFGTDSKALNFGCVARAAYTWSGGSVHSRPAYSPSVFWRKMTASTLGSSTPPPGALRMKLSGFPGKERHGRMQRSRWNAWRRPTMGL